MLALTKIFWTQAIAIYFLQIAHGLHAMRHIKFVSIVIELVEPQK